jgi:hypothetical protein
MALPVPPIMISSTYIAAGIEELQIWISLGWIWYMGSAHSMVVVADHVTPKMYCEKHTLLRSEQVYGLTTSW